jgi:hypothetical protein
MLHFLLVAILACVIPVQANIHAVPADSPWLKCSACEVFMFELEHWLNETDEKSDLKQGMRARMKFTYSEIHVASALEKVCVEMNNYTVQTKDDEPPKYFKFQNRYHEGPLVLQQMTVSMDESVRLINRCSEFQTTYEDMLTDYIVKKKTLEGLKEELCEKRARVCPVNLPSPKKKKTKKMKKRKSELPDDATKSGSPNDATGGMGEL